MAFYTMVIYVGVTIATVIFLGAKALEPLFRGQTLFGMPVDIASLAWAVGVVAAVYVAAGGLKACAWADLIQGSALIVGGEASGAGQEAEALATGKVSIPMAGGAESLNAAMAATVILFEMARQRRISTQEESL